MRFLRKHWEKIVLAIFVAAVCGWGYFLLSQSIDLQEEVANEEGAPSDAMAEPMEELSSDDFSAMRYVDEPRHEWTKVELEDGATPSAPPDLAWCINPNCDHWLPIDTEECPYCDSDQEGAIQEPETDEDEIAPLQERLHLVDTSRETFGGILQNVNVISNQPAEEWDLQIAARREDGRWRTRFRQKGDTIEIDGQEYEIVEVEHKEETRYNPRIGDEETVDRSEVTLEDSEGESIVLKRGRRITIGPWQVRLELTDPRDSEFRRRFTVNSDETLEFQDVDGTEKRFEVELREQDLVVLRPEDNPEEEIEITPRQEKQLREHRLDFPEEREYFEQDWSEPMRRR